jgi:hypothetical protein
MFLFVKVVKEEEALDFRKDLDRGSVSKENGCQPPLSVFRLVDLTDILSCHPALVGYYGRPALVDKKGRLVFHRGTIRDDKFAVG